MTVLIRFAKSIIANKAKQLGMVFTQIFNMDEGLK